MSETHQRTIARAVSWRILTLLVTIPFTGISTAILLNVFFIVVHYLFERVWLKIKWGQIKNT